MSDSLSRLEILAYSAAFGSAFLAAQGIAAVDDTNVKEEKPKEAPTARIPGKKYDMKKSHHFHRPRRHHPRPLARLSQRSRTEHESRG